MCINIGDFSSTLIKIILLSSQSKSPYSSFSFFTSLPLRFTAFYKIVGLFGINDWCCAFGLSDCRFVWIQELVFSFWIQIVGLFGIRNWCSDFGFRL